MKNNISQYLKGISPVAMLVQGYLLYMVIGWILLCIPSMHEQTVSTLDSLFIAASAVSTTGLISIDPGTNFSFLGEIVILILIQVGGIGYMTFSSFILISLRHKALNTTLRISRKAFALPKDFKISQFIRRVIYFTVAVETIGALFLFWFFSQAGEEHPLWFAIFHSISAFCTAGFSLMPGSFEGYQGHVGINLIIATLSLLGAIGFIVLVDWVDIVTGKKSHLHFTSKLIVKITFGFLLIGTAFTAINEPGLQNLSTETRWLTAFFQVMTATTTVGFNTFPMGDLSPAILMVMYFLMLFGASPSGTGGGLKSTTFAALAGLVKSTLKGRDKIRLNKRVLPLEKLQLATSSFVYYFAVLFVAVILLLLTENAPLPQVLFEVFSSLGTVGLSMGMTGDLSSIGKLIVIVLMFMGRVGILTFGIMMSMHDETREEELDNDLVI